MRTSQRLVESHPQLWHAATHAVFLDGVADGSLSATDFDRWLEQDHHFVQGLIRAWGLLLQTAPRQDLPLLTGGIVAFTAELAWFEDIARGRRSGGQPGLDFSGPLTRATNAYNQELRSLARGPYQQAITAMWAVEAAYLHAWQGVAPGADAYADYVAHWANEEFAEFVAALAAVVNRELPDGPTPGATDAFVRIARQEALFWSMTSGDRSHTVVSGGT